MAPRVSPSFQVARLFVVYAFWFLFATNTPAQTNSANLSGIIVDENGGLLPGSTITVLNDLTSLRRETETNGSGNFSVPVLPPGTYRLTVVHQGFKTVEVRDLVLNVNNERSLRIQMRIGQLSETVDITDEVPLINQSPAVSTNVDRQFVDNLPLNGRSFQSLISLSPGIVMARVSGPESPGQFSVNGQRVNANYFMVDGVSANFAAGNASTFGATVGGTTPALSTAGGTNGLVSVDAMREFSLQTSTYAPEFGRSPGGQISIVTRSGGNQFHGTAFDYWRNDLLDARNWFNRKPAPKPPLRQHDFGGTFGGPIIKNQTFFFFSYEGLRLLQPTGATSNFYTAAARSNVAEVWKPILASFPLPLANTPLDPNGRTAPLTSAWSDKFRLDATSLRIDHKLSNAISLFGRYNSSPSSSRRRFFSSISEDSANIETLTVGSVFALTPIKVNDLRVNWSRSTGTSVSKLDNFNGAVVPPNSALFPSGLDQENAQALYRFAELPGAVRVGVFNDNVQRQFNLIDTFSMSVRTHQLKFGFDWRRLKPEGVFSPVSIGAQTTSYAQLQTGNAAVVSAVTGGANQVRIDNFSLFSQDVWRINSRLTLTYGLRWESNTPPTSVTDNPLYAFQGVFDQKPLGFAPAGTPLWRTEFNNFAPRVGAAFQLTDKTFVRGGFGVYYDIGMPWVVGSLMTTAFPYVRTKTTANIPFDFNNPAFTPPPFSLTSPTRFTAVTVDPNLRMPVTYQWNAAVERELNRKQLFAITYVGSRGNDLLQTTILGMPGNPQLLSAGVNYNNGWSKYNALQLAFERRLSDGLQALVQYTFGKSIDTGSLDRNAGLPVTMLYTTDLSTLDININKGPSDTDIRHNFSAAFSYELPSPRWGEIGNRVFSDWAIDGISRARSSFPITPFTTLMAPGAGIYNARLNSVPGQPVWIPDSSNPGLQQLNPAAFSQPASGQGNVPRNSIRGMNVLTQTDLTVRRRFRITENVKLDLRVEFFNIFNHPMFLEDSATMFWGTTATPLPSFGKITQTLNNGLGGLVPIYQIGGPRSGQLSLRLSF